MDFEKTFAIRYYLNLGRREDRRTELEWHMEQVGVTAIRFPAIDARFCKKPRGYQDTRSYAQALTHRLAIRRAKLHKQAAVLLLEDDVVFHPNFRQLIDQIELPDDWGIFHLGCQLTQRPESVGDGIVRITEGWDTHAWAIHERYYDRVLAALDGSKHISSPDIFSLDQALAKLQQTIPSYACYPNLAWPAIDPKIPGAEKTANYGNTGVQKNNCENLQNLLTEQIAPEVVGRPPKLGLLFLTRGDVRNPEIWREWIAQSAEDVAIYCHPKTPDELTGGFLQGSAISESHDTAWGKVSLVRATLALMKEALKDPSLTHFALLSESCVPIQPLKRILLRLQHDGRPRFNSKDQKRASVNFRSRMRQAPEVPADCWRFHQQWWLLDRTATIMASRNDHTSKFENVFASDEGYFGTALMLEGYPVDDLIDDRPLTWTDWEKVSASPNEFETIPADRLRDIINSDSFFARKFPENCDIGQYGLHRP
jgi:GR25 family glycosyltransferase involved in LPS biosynthesis